MKNTESRILITGGAGFIGSALVWELNRRGCENIVVCDRLSTDEKWKNLVPLKFADYIDGNDLVWRGKFNKTSGSVTFDKTAQQGTVDITVDIDSIDYGFDLMNTKAKSEELFDAAKYPTATYKGKLAGFKKGMPTKVMGDLTLRGITKPVQLNIVSFKCMPHPMVKREVCGADAMATFKRDDFGMAAGKDWGFKMDVTLRIQVEALAAE